jgi:hypothetical protein
MIFVALLALSLPRHHQDSAESLNVTRTKYAHLVAEEGKLWAASIDPKTARDSDAMFFDLLDDAVKEVKDNLFAISVNYEATEEFRRGENHALRTAMWINELADSSAALDEECNDFNKASLYKEHVYLLAAKLSRERMLLFYQSSKRIQGAG